LDIGGYVYLETFNIWCVYFFLLPLFLLLIPVLSSLLVIALSRDDRSSRPFILSLSLDFASRYLRRSPPASATLERSEYARRDRDLLWYFFRGVVWQTYTR